MLDKMTDTRFGRWMLTGAVGAAMVAPAAGGAAASAEASVQSQDRYERVQQGHVAGATTTRAVTASAAANRPKTGRAAADLVVRVAGRLAKRGYNLECRASTTRLGGLGVLECKGSVRAKRELGRQIRRLIREHKIIAPEASGHYIDTWTDQSAKVVRIDWARFGHMGTLA